MNLESLIPNHVVQGLRKQFKIQNEAENEEEQGRPLKIGDIVYLKYFTEFDKMGELKENEGFFSGYLGGDGLALNSMKCFYKNYANYKTQSRFLFQIDVPESDTPSKMKQSENKALSGQVEVQEKNKNILVQSPEEIIKQTRLRNFTGVKTEEVEIPEEAEEAKQAPKSKKIYQKKRLQKGDPLWYGMKICLKHVYSEGYVTMNKYKLSNEKNSVQVGIRNQKTKDCTIKIFDPSDTKRPGEVVTASDTISIEFCSMKYNLKINEKSGNKRELEVNAGKELCMFRISAFTNSYNFLNLSHNILKNGDIIKLYNKDTDMYFSVKHKIQQFKKKKTNVRFVDGDCEELMDQEEPLQVQFLTESTVKGTTLGNFSVVPDNSENNELSFLWEVRYPYTLKSRIIGNSNTEDDAIFLKHVLTGNFLFCKDGETLELRFLDLKKNPEILDGFMFYFKMKNSWTSDNSIKFNTLITMKSKINKNLINFYERENLKYQIKISNAQQKSFPFFELQPCGKEKRISFKIKDINIRTTQFYKENKEMGVFEVSYRGCLENEDEFEQNIEEITYCIKNLINIFTEDIVHESNFESTDTSFEESKVNFKNVTLKRNQNFLLNNQILENLFDLFKILVQYMHFSLVNYKFNGRCEKNLNQLYFHITNKENPKFFQQKLPQNFFRDYLDKLIDLIIQFFYLVGYNNPKTSGFFLTRFDVFYYLLYHYKRNILRFLKEITSNSSQMKSDHQNVLATLFDDLKLPTFKLRFIQRHQNKLQFMKNLVKNLARNKTIENLTAIGEIVHNFSVSFDRNFYIQFDMNEAEEFVCKFFIVKLINTRKQELRNKIKNIKQTIMTLFEDHLEVIDQDNENFDIVCVKMEGINAQPEFHDFLKYYIKLKSRLFYCNLKLGTMLLGLKSLEADPSKHVLFKLVVQDDLNYSMKSGLVSFIAKVYLFFNKYNYFTDDYDFTYFCQKLNRVKITAFLKERPIKIMNPEITNYSEELFEIDNARAMSLTSLEKEEKKFDFMNANNYMEVIDLEEFYQDLLANMRQNIPKDLLFLNNNKESINKIIQMFKNVINTFSLIEEFFKIGYPNFAETCEIIDIIDRFIEYFLTKIMVHADKTNPDEETADITFNIFTKYKTVHNFLMETSLILKKINIYRTNFNISLFIKFFYTLAIKNNYSIIFTDLFINQLNPLVNIFNFEDDKEITALNLLENTETCEAYYKVENFRKLHKFFKKMTDTDQVQSTNEIQLFMETLEQYIPKLKQAKSTAICSNLTKIMLIMINNGDLAYKRMKARIDRSLHQFDELYYMKILKKEILQVVEDYFLRSIKVISRLRDIQIIFEDESLNNIMNMVEFDLESLQIFNDNLKKEDFDVFMVMEEGKVIIEQIKKVNEEMTKQYLNKIYFKKMQKMVQISKLPDLCLQMMNKIYTFIKASDDSTTVVKTESELPRLTSMSKPVEIPSEVRALFFELKRFFVLNMIKSDRKIVENTEQLKDQCIDVFIENGFECDDLIIELNQYLDQTVIQEELQNFFKFMEDSAIFSHFDNINSHRLEEIVDASGELKLKCQTIEQYFNVLRNLTFYPDKEMKNVFQAQIINNILQTRLMKKICEKEFVTNFCFEAKKNVPTLKANLFSYRPIMRANTFTNQQTKYTLVINSVTKVFKNLLELVCNCMKGNVFCKLVLSNQFKYQEIFDILKIQRLPLFLKSYFFRIMFDSYFSTRRVAFKKVITLIDKILLSELTVMIEYFKFHQKNTKNIPRFSALTTGIKQRIAKKVKLNSEDMDIGELYENDDDPIMQDQLDNDLDVTEGSVHEDEAEEADETLVIEDQSLAKEIPVFNPATGTLESMWFEIEELQFFLGDKMKDNQVDGFVPFIADLITFMLFNVKRQRKMLERSKDVLNELYLLLNDFYIYFQSFKKFKSKFNSEIYSHTDLLLFISLKNLHILRQKVGCLDEKDHNTQSAIRSFQTSNDISILSIDRYFGQGFTRPEMKEKLNAIPEDIEMEHLSTQTIEKRQTLLEQKSQQVLKLIRYSLITLKLTFAEVLKDLFEDELVDIELKLINLIDGLIEKAKMIPFNFFITLENNMKININYGDITLVLRFLFYKMKNANDLELADLKEDLNTPLNEIETINLIIQLNKLLYKMDVVKKPEVTLGNMARVESFTEIELADYLVSIENTQRQNFETLENFLSNQSFYSMFLNLSEFNFLEFQRVHLKENKYTKLLQQLLFQHDVPTFQSLFRRKQIEKCLSNKSSRFFYVHSLKKTIENELNALNINARSDKYDYMRELNQKQLLLNSKHVASFCISLMIQKKELEKIIISECLDILYLILVFGNEPVQLDLYRMITNNYGKINLVEFLEKHLITHSKNIKDTINGNVVFRKNVYDINNEELVKRRFLAIDSYRLLVSILRFLQVLNENCFSKFQDMFREQKFFNQNSNNNLIQKVINFIIITFGEYVSFSQNWIPKQTGGTQSVLASGTGRPESEAETETDAEPAQVKSKGVVVSEAKRQKRKVYKSLGFEKMITSKREELKKMHKEDKKSSEKIFTFLDSIKLKSLIHYAFFYINDSMMGPNKMNQKIILSNHGLIEFSISIIRDMTFPIISKGLTNIDQFDFNMYDYLLFSDAVQVLLYSTDIFDKTELYKDIFRPDIMEMVKSKMREIYEKIIHPNKSLLYSNSFCPEMDDEFSINQTSLDDVNLSSKSNLIRKDIFGNKFDTLLSVPSSPEHPDYEKNHLEVRKLLQKVIISGHNLFIFYKRATVFNDVEEKIKERYFSFFDNFFGYVELKHQQTIEILRYTKPYLTYFHYDSPKLVDDFSIEPHNEKINNFIERVDKEEEKLELRRKLYRFSRPLYYMNKNKVIVEYLFYLLIVIINLLFIINAAHKFDGDLNVTDLNLKRGSRFFDDSLNVSLVLLFGLGCVNFLLAVFIFLFNIFETIPDTKFYWKGVNAEYIEEKNALKKKKSKGIVLIYLEVMSFFTNTKFTGIGYWFSYTNIYNILMMGLSLTAIFLPLIYPFLLLDIIQRSLTLKNIVRSVTNNWVQLILTTIVTLIIMYIYAAISFTYFPDQYGHSEDDDFVNYCHTLYHCFFSVLNNGLRAGGGLGEAIGQPTIEDTRYVMRYWVDLTFMIIILIILLNIVFGIIIDTFGDMRNERDEWHNYITNTCILCDLTKGEIDSKGEGYYKHINLSHSVEDYVHFLVYIKNRNLNDCDGMEQKVKIKYEVGDYTFLPHQESFYYNLEAKDK